MKNFTKFVVGFVAVAALFVAANASAYSHTTLLKMGMSSSQVMELQKTLNAGGFLVSTTGAGSPGMESMYFGAKTKAAVMAFQSAKGLGADGVVGINTGTALSAMTGGSVSYPAGCSSTTGYSSTTGVKCDSTGNTGSTGSTGSLSGTDGTIDSVKMISSYNNEEIGEGENDVKVAGFEVQASNEGDIALRSLRVEFNTYAGSGSTRISDYMTGVSVWAGSTKVGSADASDFNKDSSGVYSKTITLSDAVIRADKKVTYYVTADAVNNFDSTDIATSPDWNLDINSIRFEDGSGVVSSDATTGDLPMIDIGLDFVSFATSADTELKISKSSDNPVAGIVIVDDNSETQDVVLLKGKLRLDGTSDVNIDEIPVTFSVAGGDNLSSIANSLILVIDGQEYSENSATVSGGATSTITFDDLDFDLNAGDSVDYEVRADINGTNDFNSGSTITASITSDNRSAMVVENENGDSVSDSDKTGTSVGEAQEFRSEGISVTLVSTDESVNADGTLGTYTIKFKVAAVGDDAYVGTATSKYTYAFQEASRGATTSGFSAAITNNGGSGNSTTTTAGGNWKINDGTSITLELQVFGNGASLSAGAYRAALSAIGWESSDADAALANSYTSNMDDFHTAYEQII